MAGLLTIAYPKQQNNYTLAYESKSLKGVVVITADSLAQAKAKARKTYKGCAITEWSNK